MLMFTRHPSDEYATFARFGWHEGGGRLVLTLASLDSPRRGDLDLNVGHVAIQERYTLRTALASEQHRLAVGVVHSHPEECRPAPSSIDDDMDEYYADYFCGFAPGRPYISLIISRMKKAVAVSGRIFFNGEWLTLTRVAAATASNLEVEAWPNGHPRRSLHGNHETVARLAAAFGKEATNKLRSSSVAVIGAGGTGSAAIEALARAGVGRLVLIDPDTISRSNLERVHGSVPDHAASQTAKSKVAADHVRAINPACKVEAFVGALPQEEILSAVVSTDVAIGCTDQQHSRLALSDIAVRYLLPAIDCGVALEGQHGRITGQIMQLVTLYPNDPCLICQGMFDASRVTQELMSDEERQNRRTAARKAINDGAEPTAYWREEPQLNTVGYLTSAAGAMAAGYAIGWITGRFDPPFRRVQMNWSAKLFDVTDTRLPRKPECSCGRVVGWADQGAVEAYVTAPAHWRPVERLLP